jgi:predicted permease
MPERLHAVWLRLRALLRRRQAAQDVEDELAFHLEMRERQLRTSGAPDADARARRQFGNVTRIREDLHEAWQLAPRLGHAARDVKYAVRTLRRNPGFATIVVVTLGLGIGANSAIFAAVNAILLEPLRYPDAARLMRITTVSTGPDPFSVSPPEYFEFTELNRSFSSVGAFRVGEANLSANDRPRRVKTAGVDRALLETLAVPPALGRWFRTEDTRSNGPATVVLLSDAQWRTTFGGRPDILGQSVAIDGVRREIVGVMPAGFDLMDHGIDAWLPGPFNPFNRQNRGNHVLQLVGRLKAGTTEAQARGELASLTATWGARVGQSFHVFTPEGHRLQIEPLHQAVVGSAARTIWILQAAASLVLLVACANFGALLLARGEGRRHELAIRTALGAGRRRLLTQFATEGLLLALLGAALAIALAVGGLRAITLAFPDSLPRAAEVSIDARVLGLTLLVSLVAGIVVGVAPLWRLSRRDPREALDNGARVSTSMRHRVRAGLITAEIALAIVVVIGAGLLVRTVINLQRLDPGFERSRLVTFALDLPVASYQTMRPRVVMLERLRQALLSVPGVERVSGMTGLPPHRPYEPETTAVANYTPPEGGSAQVDYRQRVALGYFETLGIPIVAGRPFVETDRIGPAVAIVNETLARTFWNGRNPIGQQIKWGDSARAPWMTVVGVARDVKQNGVDQPAGTEMFTLDDQFLASNFAGGGAFNLVLRTTATAAALQPAIQQAVKAADPSLPVIRLREMSEVFDDALRRPRLLVTLFGGFAGLALIIAAVGVYAVLSHVVSERRREIGVRMTLGAHQTTMLVDVLGRGLRMAMAGLAIGTVAALVLTRAMRTLLFGVEPADPLTLLVVAAGLVGVATLACLVPALRAMRVDPLTALRGE